MLTKESSSTAADNMTISRMTAAESILSQAELAISIHTADLKPVLSLPRNYNNQSVRLLCQDIKLWSAVAWGTHYRYTNYLTISRLVSGKFWFAQVKCVRNYANG